MKKYTTPTVEYTEFKIHDVITVSVGGDGEVYSVGFGDLLNHEVQ